MNDDTPRRPKLPCWGATWDWMIFERSQVFNGFGSQARAETARCRGWSPCYETFPTCSYVPTSDSRRTQVHQASPIRTNHPLPRMITSPTRHQIFKTPVPETSFACGIPHPAMISASCSGPCTTQNTFLSCIPRSMSRHISHLIPKKEMSAFFVANRCGFAILPEQAEADVDENEVVL